LYAPPDPEAEENVHVMTIHAAKGLEFDAVIVPGLGKPPRSEERQALLWAERIPPGGPAPDLLLAPIPASGTEDPLYRYVQGLHNEKADHELGRLLYVAVTRARKRLHLLGHAELRGDGALKPREGTFLSRLWDALEAEFAREAARPGQDAPAPPDDAIAPPPSLRRLTVDWSAPEPPPSVQVPFAGEEEPAEPGGPPLIFDWAHLLTRHVGTVVHAALQRMAALGPEAQTPAWIAARAHRHRAHLLSLGLPREQLDDGLARVSAALQNTVADPRGRWLLKSHPESRSEWALSTVLDGRPLDVKLDRTFLDESGTRWIVDYKSSSHQGAGLETFLDEERERYRPQLERYARVLAAMEERPIRLGLYFPLLQGWREWVWERG
jgi:ATP-dependent exoDNAse (exonuclease V) beta subunit